MCYNFETDADYNGTIKICIEYDDTDLDPIAESSLRLRHYVNGDWANITISHNKDLNMLCGRTSSLSPFVLAYSLGFLCGDVNDDLMVNILDVVYLINYKYKDGFLPNSFSSADVNADDLINILDVVYLINFKYKGGPDPICP